MCYKDYVSSDKFSADKEYIVVNFMCYTRQNYLSTGLLGDLTYDEIYYRIIGGAYGSITMTTVNGRITIRVYHPCHKFIFSIDPAYTTNYHEACLRKPASINCKNYNTEVLEYVK